MLILPEIYSLYYNKNIELTFGRICNENYKYFNINGFHDGSIM